MHQFFSKKGFIFDLDGTLVDSMQYWYSSELRALTSHEERMEYMREKYDSVQIKPFVVDFLIKCRENGILLSIASATDLRVSEKCIERLSIFGYIPRDRYLSNSMVGVDKTFPTIYLESAKRLGLDPRDCVVFEDHPRCARVARDAGFFTVGVYDEVFRDRAEELRSGTDIVIESFSEFL